MISLRNWRANTTIIFKINCQFYVGKVSTFSINPNHRCSKALANLSFEKSPLELSMKTEREAIENSQPLKFELQRVIKKWLCLSQREFPLFADFNVNFQNLELIVTKLFYFIVFFFQKTQRDLHHPWWWQWRFVLSQYTTTTTPTVSIIDLHWTKELATGTKSQEVTAGLKLVKAQVATMSAIECPST